MGSVTRRVNELEEALAVKERMGPMPDPILVRGADGVARDSRGEPVDVEAAAARWARWGVRVHVLTRAERDQAERDAIVATGEDGE